ARLGEDVFQPLVVSENQLEPGSGGGTVCRNHGRLEPCSIRIRVEVVAGRYGRVDVAQVQAPRRNLRARLNGGGDQGHQECHANERSMGHGPPRLALVRGGINRRSRDSTGRRSAVENRGLIRDTRTVMMPARKRRDRFTAILVAVALLATFLCAVLSGCGKDDAVVKPAPNYRTYFMGFSSFPPKLSIASILETIDAFAPHSDYGMILAEPPWDSLLAGRPPDSLIRANQVGLAAYFRSKGLRVLVSIDPTNGLDRASDAAPLVAA